MDLKIQKFKKRFDLLLEYEKKMPGIKIGLDILRLLHFEKIDIKMLENSESKCDVVYYYSFIDNSIESYDFDSLNTKTGNIYNYWILEKNYIQNNNFYSKICQAYDRTYIKFNYKYKNTAYSKHDLISKFFQGLRNNETEDKLKHFINPSIDHYKYIQYFEEVTGEEFYFFMLDFIIELHIEGILEYVRSDYSMVFNKDFLTDLQKFKYLSFELMYFGESKIYDNFYVSNLDFQKTLDIYSNFYSSSDEETRYYIDDVMTSFAISSAVDTVCAARMINNNFIEKIINVQSKSNINSI